MAQINAPENEGLISRAESMARQNNYLGALDQIKLLNYEAMSGEECSKADMLKANYTYAAGRYETARELYNSYLAKYPFSVDREVARKGIGDCFLAEKKYAEAAEVYAGVNENGLASSEAAELSYRRGVCAIENGDKEYAGACFEKSLKDPDMRMASLFYLAYIDFENGDYKSARQRFASSTSSTAPGNLSDFYIASIDFIEGNYGKALSTARQLLRKQGLSPDVEAELNRIAGESLYREGQRYDAVEYLRKYATAVDEPQPSALYILGLDEFEHGNYSKALEYFQPVTENGDGALRQSAYLYAGQCLLEQGDTSSAILAFDKAAKATDDTSVREAAFYNYASAKFAGASVPFASSAEVFEEFLSLYPSGPYSDRVSAYLATGYMADNDYERALARLNSINNPSPKMLEAKQRVLYALGTRCLSENALSEAESYLSQAESLSRYGAEIAAETSLSQAHLQRMKGNNAEAVVKYQTFLQSAAAKTSANRDVALYGIAYSYYNMKDAGRAETYFNQALPLMSAPEAKADILNRLGDIKFACADFGAAEKCYSQAYDANPSAGDYAALCVARMKGYMRDYEGKLGSLNTFRREFPTSALMPEALLETTQAQISLGRNAAAVNTYRTLISDYPQTSQGRRGYLQMAMTLLDMGEVDQAAEAYRSVIALYPTSDEASQASSLLKTLYADNGRAEEFFAFMSGVDNAPKIDPGEAEELAFTSARNAYQNRNDKSQLEAFVVNYPESTRAASALSLLLKDAENAGNEDEMSALAEKIMSRYPDSRAAEGALAVMAKQSYSAGDLPAAMETYQNLEKKASDTETATIARLGVMRTARDMGNYEIAGTAADAIMASSASASALSEAKYTKALSLDARGETDDAVALWLEMSSDTSDLFGAKSAYGAAQTLYDEGKNKQALDVAQKFVKSGSPHRYWVARGFILISDIYTAQGKTFEAREYLEALKENYPGSEADIFMMIESRLSDDK